MRTQLRPSAPVVSPEAAFRATLLIALAVFWLPYAGAKSIPRPHRQPKRIVHIIEKLEEQWRLAELHGDTAVMATMLSDDYLGIYGDGTLSTKTQTMDGFKRGAIHFSQIDTSDQKIRVYGTTAVVVSKAEVTGTHYGDAVNGLFRYTRVYHRINGVWKIVTFEASALHQHHPMH